MPVRGLASSAEARSWPGDLTGVTPALGWLACVRDLDRRTAICPRPACGRSGRRTARSNQWDAKLDENDRRVFQKYDNWGPVGAPTPLVVVGAIGASLRRRREDSGSDRPFASQRRFRGYAQA